MPSIEYQIRKTTNHMWNMQPTSSGSELTPMPRI